MDLGFLRYVSAIGTQGAISKETKKAYYVKTYKVSISTNGEDWIMVKDGTKHKVWDNRGNFIKKWIKKSAQLSMFYMEMHIDVLNGGTHFNV